MLSPMKFLLECVSCYGTPTPEPSLSKSTRPTVAESWSSSLENSITVPSSALRRRSRSLSRPGPGDWKPSLNVICEDNVAAEPLKPKPKVAPNQITRAASERRSGHGRAISFGRDHSPLIVPSFAPTPFMF